MIEVQEPKLFTEAEEPELSETATWFETILLYTLIIIAAVLAANYYLK